MLLKLKKLFSFLFLLTLFFVWAYLLQGHYLQVVNGLLQVDELLFILSLSMLLLSYFFAIYNWRRQLLLVKEKFPFRSACRVWLLANLAKYLPGTIWIPLSRGIYGKDEKLSSVESVYFWGLEIVLQLSSGMLIVALSSSLDVTHPYRLYTTIIVAVLLLAMLFQDFLLGFFLRVAANLKFKVISGKIDQALSCAKKIKKTDLFFILIYYLIFWSFMGGWLFTLSYAVVGRQVTDITFFIRAWALSWMAGYLVVFMPGGLGVRESVLTSLFVTQGVSLESAVLISLLSRFQYFLLDGVLACVFVKQMKNDYANYFLVLKQMLGLQRFKLITKFFGCPGKVLDVGCGTGHNLIALHSSFSCGVGIDLSESRLEIARRFVSDKKIDNIVFKSHSGLDLPFLPASFDLVICTEVLEHVEDDSQLLANLVQVLKPGGRLIISVPADRQFSILNRYLVDKVGENDHVRPGYSFAKLERMLEKEDLTVFYWGYFGQFFSSFFHYLISLFGSSRQITVESVSSTSILLRVYDFVRPLLYAISLFDRMIPRSVKGGFLFVVADNLRSDKRGVDVESVSEVRY